MNIEKNIPIPKARKDGGIANTLRLMEVGDSVVVPYHNHPSWRSVARAMKLEVSGRKVSDTEIRIWRTK